MKICAFNKYGMFQEANLMTNPSTNSKFIFLEGKKLARLGKKINHSGTERKMEDNANLNTRILRRNSNYVRCLCYHRIQV